MEEQDIARKVFVIPYADISRRKMAPKYRSGHLERRRGSRAHHIVTVVHVMAIEFALKFAAIQLASWTTYLDVAQSRRLFFVHFK
jgi:hypothetical protein